MRALTRVATAETEERLLAVGRAGTADHVERVRGWRRVDRLAEAARPRGSARAALLVQALAAARETPCQRGRPHNQGADPPTMARQQADVLALLAETALHHGMDPGAPGERYQGVVHVDAPALADPDPPGQSVLEDGAHVSAETSRRLACDASRVVMQHGGAGRVVEVASAELTIKERPEARV